MALIDTQELYADARLHFSNKIGFADLVNKTVKPPKDLEKDKDITRTDWSNRPCKNQNDPTIV